MASVSTKPQIASYEDILRLPENVIGEIVDGDLIVSPRPAARHALASSAIGGELAGPFHRGRGGPGGWVILFEPELHLGAQVLVPDLAGWRRERMATFPDVAYFSLAPDWVCEVLSPATAIVDRTGKQHIYREHGVSWLWFVDPSARTIEVLSRGERGWLVADTFGGEGEARIPPFDAVVFDIGALWDINPPPGQAP
ncbi:MAG: Uma2 family endonuclease [Deltaproteobacteria bacterium]|nr:Uma2 family endonuclease [Deltaproteobacteria bacterium]